MGVELEPAPLPKALKCLSPKTAVKAKTSTAANTHSTKKYFKGKKRKASPADEDDDHGGRNPGPEKRYLYPSHTRHVSVSHALLVFGATSSLAWATGNTWFSTTY